jgi:PD-(D/E)XK endonuclease
MIPNPTSKGKTTEAIILSALVRLGKTVLIPWGEERYDLVLDVGERFVRIQCKTGFLRNGCVVFKTCITDARRPQGDGGYAGQIDAFAVFCPPLSRGFLVPIDEVASPHWGHLRVEPTLNGQVRNIRWARDYEIPIPQVELVDLRGLNGEVVDGDLVAVAAGEQADAAAGQVGVRLGDHLGAVD